MEIPRGEVANAKVPKEKYAAKLEFMEGWGCKQKIPSLGRGGGVDIL